MKKFFLATGIVTMITVFSCNTAKKITGEPKLTYSNNVSAMITTHCTPCHIPAKGGNKKAYDNYANVKTDIDEIIRRINLNPGDRGFMPFKHPKLSDSVIAVFTKWKADGMIE
jgi:hypothetical protein